MGAEEEHSIWPAQRELAKQLRIMAGERRALELRRHEAAEQADRVASAIAELQTSLAHAAGITRQELIDLVETHGRLGVEVLQVLAQNQAETVKKAIDHLYQQAGDEAGKYVDWLARISGQKFQATEWEKLIQEEYNHDHPKKKKPRPKVPWKQRLADRAWNNPSDSLIHQLEEEAWDLFDV